MNDFPHAAERDTFAEIAAQKRLRWSKELEQPGPAPFRPVKLPPMVPARGPIRRSQRIADQAGLDAALANLRTSHEQFLANHAPALEALRESVQLETFMWRLETAADRANFAGVLAGEGGWEPVTIPHYGPPEGRATAYYRTLFTVTPAMLARGSIHARFRGVDYKAHVFVNGAFLGSHEGFFAPFEFECSAHVHPGENVLVVRVENDAIMMGNSSWGGPSAKLAGDKLYAATGPGYDDPEVGWHHCPPAMGIYQPVCVEARARVHIGDLFVRPLPEAARAELRLEVFNCDVLPQEVAVEVSIYGRNFKHTVVERMAWQPRAIRVPGLSDMDKQGDNEVVTLPTGSGVNYFTIPIDLPRFRWWSPEEPWLYQAQVRLVGEAGAVRDAVERQFGMRSFAIDESTDPKGTPTLNGRPIRLRGANTMGFEQLSVMRRDWDRLRDDLLLAKLAHMNFLRLTQRPVQDEVYDWCDRLGIMTQTDLPLFGCLRRNQFVEALRQCGEMERLVRAHPCNIVVSYINEPFPNADGNPCRHLTRPELEEFFRAADVVVRQMNPDRVIKPVDGDYDPPAPGLPDIHCYNGWYLSNGVGLGQLHKGFWQHVKPGWNFGCGEFGAEGLEDEATMRRHYPRRWLPAEGGGEADWTPSQITRAQTGAFHYMWFERPASLAGWIRRSQEHHAWVTKLMAESFRRNRRMVSCAIHHYIDAFPAGWMKAIVDVDRRAKPAYFAYRDALTPRMVSLRSDRNAFFAGERWPVEAWACSDVEAPAKARLEYSLTSGSGVLRKGAAAVRVPGLSSAMVGLIEVDLPREASGQQVVLRAALLDGKGRVLHENELPLKVFERPPAAERIEVTVVGAKRGVAARLARDLKLKVGSRAGIWLIDGAAGLSKKDRTRVEQAVKGGAHAIILNLEPGDHEVGADVIPVRRCAMGPRHFVARVPGSSVSGGFAPDDFKFWYDRKLDRAAPILDAMFDAPGWEPILTSGNPAAGGEWGPAMAVATQRAGAGRWTISQLSLAGRIAGNPVAELFARRLIVPASAI